MTIIHDFNFIFNRQAIIDDLDFETFDNIEIPPEVAVAEKEFYIKNCIDNL